FLLSSSLQVASQELQKESWFAPYKKQQLLNALDHPEQFNDRPALYHFIPFVLEEYPRDRMVYQKTQTLSENLIREFTDSMWFSYARITVKQHDRFFPETERVRTLKRTLVVKDFKENYYGSRLLKKEVNGQSIPEYIWNGNDLICDAGSIPPSIQNKVEQRINYFRRAAGVPDYVKLDTIKNEACQKAALIYQVNTGKFFTEPAETWKCYAYSAVEAAQLSARVFGQTTVFAVTSIMADQGEANTFVGNRRWLLYPPARDMGHGSTNKVSLIWTLDDAGDKDTTEYMEDFVSWPPRDYCPIMFAFDRWSFSLYADLSKAKVSMSLDGKPLAIKQETQVSGYGMPTLVWTPDFKPEQGKKYTVTIQGVKLHGNSTPRTYQYTVEFIDPMKE
ncbi:MAG: CAP domain-containing protein, partial [Bacteroidota bacterium]|nr:CAP domain-containing protein [Bacteroidota bacterium]MDX5429626.1 CAP domain-containing protein [Bacteroidota bacterium]MDX5468410.1 CAP domain-containing protein [Bacteroidota bacterium]